MPPPVHMLGLSDRGARLKKPLVPGWGRDNKPPSTALFDAEESFGWEWALIVYKLRQCVMPMGRHVKV